MFRTADDAAAQQHDSTFASSIALPVATTDSRRLRSRSVGDLPMFAGLKVKLA
jgi:hypothetical protein